MSLVAVLAPLINSWLKNDIGLEPLGFHRISLIEWQGLFFAIFSIAFRKHVVALGLFVCFGFGPTMIFKIRFLGHMCFRVTVFDVSINSLVPCSLKSGDSIAVDTAFYFIVR